MIDTHAHLDGEEFKEDIDEVVDRAKKSGIENVFIPCINTKDLPHLLDTCRAYPDYFNPMLGIHPEEIHASERENEQDLETIEKILKEISQRDFRIDAKKTSPRVIAIGEVGLDYYWDDSLKELQKEVFIQQIKWANYYNLPLMIHARNAHQDLVELLCKNYSPAGKGIFHCFSGTTDEAQELKTKFPGFMFGIGGILTFKKSKLPQTLQEAEIPLERIVLETDAPYMAPVPHRGKRNESAFVTEVASFLANIYGVSIDDIDKITTRNCKKTFNNGPWK